MNSSIVNTFHFVFSAITVKKNILPGPGENRVNLLSKVNFFLNGSLDLIPSPSVKILIMGGKVCLRCKGKTFLGVVKKFLNTKLFEFSLKLKVMGSNLGYFLKYFLLYLLKYVFLN